MGGVELFYSVGCAVIFAAGGGIAMDAARKTALPIVRRAVAHDAGTAFAATHLLVALSYWVAGEAWIAMCGIVLQCSFFALLLNVEALLSARSALYSATRSVAESTTPPARRPSPLPVEQPPVGPDSPELPPRQTSSPAANDDDDDDETY